MREAGVVPSTGCAMRLWCLSDLHVDIRPWEMPCPAPEFDVVVIAGDARERLTKRALPWVAETFVRLGKPVVYVPGNHDFYHANYDVEVARAPEAAAALGITLLLDGSLPVAVGGTRFVGATLWSDYRINGTRDVSMTLAGERMNDHRLIRASDDYRRFSPRYAEIVHGRALAALDAGLSEPFGGPTVVVTHHAPAPPSLDDRYAREPLDGSYVSDLSALVARHAPSLWVHGHVHRSRDYALGATRVLSNPRGYLERRMRGGRLVSEEDNPAFDPGLVVEIPSRGVERGAAGPR